MGFDHLGELGLEICSALLLGYVGGRFGFGFRWGIEELCSSLCISLSTNLWLTRATCVRIRFEGLSRS